MPDQHRPEGDHHPSHFNTRRDNLRSIEATRNVEATETISFSAAVLASLGQLGGPYPGRSIDWTLSGDLGVIHLEKGRS